MELIWTKYYTVALSSLVRNGDCNGFNLQTYLGQVAPTYLILLTNSHTVIHVHIEEEEEEEEEG